MTTAKRQTLADYLYYSICQGQAEMGRSATRRCRSTWCRPASTRSRLLHTADAKVDLTNENVDDLQQPDVRRRQPDRNYLAQIAPQPTACDKRGRAVHRGHVGTGPGRSTGGRRRRRGAKAAAGGGAEAAGGTGTAPPAATATASAAGGPG